MIISFSYNRQPGDVFITTKLSVDIETRATRAVQYAVPPDRQYMTLTKFVYYLQCIVSFFYSALSVSFICSNYLSYFTSCTNIFVDLQCLTLGEKSFKKKAHLKKSSPFEEELSIYAT